jgi:O-antigen/teichoic acid export membrane protein
MATATSGLIWGVGTFATFGVGVILARLLGPTGYGAYGTALALVALLAVPTQLGLPLLATREVSATRVHGQPADLAAIGWWFAALVAGTSVLVGVALWLAADDLPFAPAVKRAIATAAWLLPALALSGLAAGMLRGQERVVTSQLLDVLIRPLAFMAALLAWSRPLGPGQAICAQIVAASGIALVGFAVFFRGLPSPTLSTHHIRKWGKAALPMLVLEAMRALEGNYPVLIAGYAASIADAGLLRVALASSVIVSLPISLQTIVTGPFMARAHAAEEPLQLARIVAASTLFMSVTVGFALSALALVGGWALPFAFGQAFAGAYVPLLVLGGNQLLIAMMGPAVMLLSMTGHERVVARAFIVSVIAAVAAALVLTPLFGVAGAAGSLIVGTAIRGAILNRHARLALGIAPSLIGAVRLLGGIGLLRTESGAR